MKAGIDKKRATTQTGQQIDLKTICVGETVELQRVEDLARVMNLLTPKTGKPAVKKALNILNCLQVPVIVWADGEFYFNVSALEKALFIASRFGGHGLATPGTATKYRSVVARGLPDELSNEEIEKAVPGLLDEMAHVAASRRKAEKNSLMKTARAAGKSLQRRMKEKEHGKDTR